MKVLGGIGAVVVGVLAIAAIVLGGWLAGWWFKEQNTEKQAHIYRKSYANQERLREDALEKISTVRGIEVQTTEEPSPQLKAQAQAISVIACRDIAQVSELEPELESFAASYCGGGY